MSIVQIPWHDAEALRTWVLGRRTGPVPGDDDPAATHLAQRDDDGKVIAVVSFMPHPCPKRPDARETAVSFYERAGAVANGLPYDDQVTELSDRRIVLMV